MSKHEFDPNCLDCQPALVDMRTGVVLPREDPQVQMLMEVWRESSLSEQKAHHSVTCKNSRDPEDMRLSGAFIDRFMRRCGSN